MKETKFYPQAPQVSSALPGKPESACRKGTAPDQYAGANPYRKSLQLLRDLL
jgi:hypothetical protein